MSSDFFSLFRRREPPVILQTEEAECGLACLAMCAAALGYETDLLMLRQRHPVSLKGTTLGRLVEIATDLKLNARAVRLEVEELSRLSLPCILHWELNHFVVLVEVNARGIVVNDPALGRRQYSMEEVGKRFSGVAMELSPRADFQPKVERTRLDLRAFFDNQPGLASAFTQVLLLSLALESFGILLPLINQWLIDDVVVTGDLNLLIVLSVAIFLLLVTLTVTRMLRGWVLLAASITWNLRTSSSVFQHLVRLPVSFFEKRHVGDVLSRFRSVDEIQGTISGNFIETILDGLMAVIALTMMVIYSPKLAGIAVLAGIGYVLVRFAMFGRYRAATEERIVRSATRDSFLYETLRGIPAIKFFSQIGWQVAGWMNRQVAVYNATIVTRKLDLVYQGANGLIRALENSLILFLTIGMILEKSYTIGMMIAFLAFKEQFLTRVVALADRLARFRLLRLQAERLSDIVLTEPENEQPLADHMRIDRDGPIEIELRGVSFRYAPGEDEVIRNISFKLTTTDSIAIVGPSGCGKSTLMKIVSGVLKPEEGEVLVNGIPVSSIGTATYRSLIGTVMQEDHLFSGSIFDNISMFDSAPDDERVALAAKRAMIHDDIVIMPMGYQSLVGGMGTNLSGGQKQRILLARALYKEPRFLFLDEYTSMLDYDTEMAVQNSLASLPIGRFVITHRRRNLLPQDRVFVVWEGGILPGHEFDRMFTRLGDPTAAARHGAGSKGTALKVVFASELGGALGHLTRQVPIALQLRRRGHEMLFGVRDPSAAEALLAPHRLAWVAAPRPVLTRSLAEHTMVYADILAEAGFAEPEALLAVVRAWTDIFRNAGADVVVCDHSPAAQLAARLAGLPTVQIGTGFELPPEGDALPVLRTWDAAAAGKRAGVEAGLLEAIRHVCEQSGRPPLARLADLYATDAPLLLTIPEADCFAPRASGRYLGPIHDVAFGRKFDWPAGNRRIFAYLRPEYLRGRESLHAVLDGLAKSGAAVLAYVPGAEDDTVAAYTTESMRVLREPVRLASVLGDADLAVSNAGNAVLNLCLLSGVPMLLLPFHFEQRLAALRAESTGAVRWILNDAVVASFGPVLTEMLGSGVYSAQARAVAKRNAGYNVDRVVATVADIVEAVAVPGGDATDARHP